MEEKKLVPKLRFPGFTEPWEQRTFSELFEYERPDAYIVQSDLYCDEYNVPVLTANKAFILGYTNEECTYNKPSIIFDDFTLDRKYVDFPYMLKSSAIKILTAKENHNLRFLFERLNSTRFEVLGHARHYISVVQNTSTLCPTLDEENCISTILTKVDTLITLHQRKLEHLKLKKKSLLQKLFPKEGEVYPELRFPGFTDPWEQRKGDEIFISVSDKGYPQLPVLSASQELGMVYRDENGIDIHHNKSNEDTYKRVLPGQFVIHLRSFQGGFAYSNVEGITSPAYTVITFKNPELYYGLFWKQVFKSLTFIKHLETITYGIRDGRSISFSDFRSLKLCYPTYGEQKFIGDGLEKTDNLITLHQRKLEHLQLLKKALLQQLFV